MLFATATDADKAIRMYSLQLSFEGIINLEIFDGFEWFGRRIEVHFDRSSSKASSRSGQTKTEVSIQKSGSDTECDWTFSSLFTNFLTQNENEADMSTSPEENDSDLRQWSQVFNSPSALSKSCDEREFFSSSQKSFKSRTKSGSLEYWTHSKPVPFSTAPRRQVHENLHFSKSIEQEDQLRPSFPVAPGQPLMGKSVPSTVSWSPWASQFTVSDKLDHSNQWTAIASGLPGPISWVGFPPVSTTKP